MNPYDKEGLEELERLFRRQINQMIARGIHVRKKQGISVSELSRITGLGITNIKTLEAGTKLPNTLTLLKYLKGLGLNLQVCSNQ